jgi:hypothetical protein
MKKYCTIIILLLLFSVLLSCNKDEQEIEIYKDDFIGNVCQIVIFDINNEALAYGSGFVFNQEGWFITNNHVMEDAYFAKAIFEIPNPNANEAYTVLDIIEGSYSNPSKDMFIGKISNYELINSFYKEFKYATSHKMDERSFSIGYPDKAVSMQINSGYLSEDVTTINDKLYSGLTYISSTSYISHGSSGGILVNENLEILGITTSGVTYSGTSNGAFMIGYSIDSKYFVDLISLISEDDLLDINVILHPNEYDFLKLLFETMFSTSVIVTEDDYRTSYTYKWEDNNKLNEKGIAFTETREYIIRTDFTISYNVSIYQENGDRITASFASNNCFEMDDLLQGTYQYTYFSKSESETHELQSRSLNYSPNVNLTLNSFTRSGRITEEVIQYAKIEFNKIYEFLVSEFQKL